MEGKLPEYSKLEKPHKVEGLPTEQKKSFYEMAKERVRIVGAEEHASFEQDMYGLSQYPAAVYIVSNRKDVIEGKVENFVDALDINVNKDFFFVDKEDYTDLIPYAVEHEVYEAWLWSKRGHQPSNSTTRHLLARIKEVECAFKDGKAERMLEFYKRKMNNGTGEEFDFAYQKVLKRNKKN